MIDDVAQQGIQGPKEAVEIALKLIGVIGVVAGMMRLAERAGLVQVLARAIRPLMRPPLSEVPPSIRPMGRDDDEHGSTCSALARRDSGLASVPCAICNDSIRVRTLLRTRCALSLRSTPARSSSFRPTRSQCSQRLVRSGQRQSSARALVATTVSTVVGIVSVKLLEKLRLVSHSAQAAARRRGEGPLQTIVGATERRCVEWGRETPPQSRLPELRWCGRRC